jgi:hypothetical protein
VQRVAEAQVDVQDVVPSVIEVLRNCCSQFFCIVEIFYCRIKINVEKYANLFSLLLVTFSGNRLKVSRERKSNRGVRLSQISLCSNPAFRGENFRCLRVSRFTARRKVSDQLVNAVTGLV